MTTGGGWRALNFSSTVSRRDLLIGGGLAGILSAYRAPYARADRTVCPKVTHGVATGDPSPDGVLVWSRCDRRARLRVDWSLDPSFRIKTTIFGTRATQATDFTARARLIELPPGELIYYRVLFAGEGKRATSEPAYGQFRMPTNRSTNPYRFLWSGDVCGQGFGINPELGGLRIFDAMRARRPDVFVHCGDVIYADGPLREKKRLPDGRIWKNLVTPEKRKVAETMAEFHGNYRYNLMDQHLRRFNQEVPQIVLWDDHETKNNWWPGMRFRDARYVVKDDALLAKRARKAFFDYVPIIRNASARGRIYRHLRQSPLVEFFALDGRSYRGPNGVNRQRVPSSQTAFFGAAQSDWLVEALHRSTALWKIIATPQPLSVLIAHDVNGFDGIGNGQGKMPAGRELELARILSGIKARGIRNCIWIAADVHYAAAHRYEPERAIYRDFDAFWEFLAGPLNAGTFGPNPLDPTFGPTAQYVSLPVGVRQGASPLDGHQFFGQGDVSPQTGQLTVSLNDMHGRSLWSVTIDPNLS
ncbi:MAG: alkaline phosphatase D family protein [Myxococcota bacterium]|nr:alkaline phosphatase D family protein [Myxococcota bacterium]